MKSLGKKTQVVGHPGTTESEGKTSVSSSEAELRKRGLAKHSTAGESQLQNCGS